MPFHDEIYRRFIGLYIRACIVALICYSFVARRVIFFSCIYRLILVAIQFFVQFALMSH